MASLKDKYCIVGVGETEYSRQSARSTRAMAVEAVRNAMRDAGLGKDGVDGMMSYQSGDSVFADHSATRQNGKVLEHRFTAITEARSFHSQHVQRTAQFVEDQGCQRFTINIFRDDDQFALAKLDEFLQDGDKVLGSA